MEISCLAALALGHIFVGTCHGDVTSTILQTLLERDYTQLTNKFIKFMSLGLGLLYMGRTEQAEDVLETIDAIEHPISKTLKVWLIFVPLLVLGMYYKSKHYYKCVLLNLKINWKKKKLEQSEEEQQQQNKDTKSNGEGGEEEEDVEMEDAESKNETSENTTASATSTTSSSKKGDSSSAAAAAAEVTKGTRRRR